MGKCPDARATTRRRGQAAARRGEGEGWWVAGRSTGSTESPRARTFKFMVMPARSARGYRSRPSLSLSLSPLSLRSFVITVVINIVLVVIIIIIPACLLARTIALSRIDSR